MNQINAAYNVQDDATMLKLVNTSPVADLGQILAELDQKNKELEATKMEQYGTPEAAAVYAITQFSASNNVGPPLLIRLEESEICFLAEYDLNPITQKP